MQGQDLFHKSYYRKYGYSYTISSLCTSELRSLMTVVFHKRITIIKCSVQTNCFIDMSVCLSVRPSICMYQFGSNRTDFLEFLHCMLLLKSLDKIIQGDQKSFCAPDDYNPQTIDELKMAITEYIRNVDRAILNTVFENTVRLVNKCLETGGGHFEHYL